ncbi:hypothetical protein BH18ACT10_BH18ACT10_11050 [soil metagenome]|nr:hypothetical protein [Rubrobacter sp.]
MADGILDLARAVSAAALATDGVYSLGIGRYAEAATYEGGEKVSGVVVKPDEVEVHIVASYPLAKPIPELAQLIRDRVAAEAGERRTSVVVEDIEVASEDL